MTAPNTRTLSTENARRIQERVNSESLEVVALDAMVSESVLRRAIQGSHLNESNHKTLTEYANGRRGKGWRPGPTLSDAAREWLKQRYSVPELMKLGRSSDGSVRRALSGMPIKLESRDLLEALYKRHLSEQAAE